MRQCIFLDRDGVINFNRDNYVCNTNDFEFIPGALEALQFLGSLSYSIVVITNQSPIGRGILSRKALRDIHNFMLSNIQSGGGRVDAIYVCPHTPMVNCTCRKPNPGLILKAAEDMQLDLQHSIFIGDALSDMHAAQAVQVLPIFVKSGRDSYRIQELQHTTPVFGSLQEVANHLKDQTHRNLLALTDYFQG